VNDIIYAVGDSHGMLKQVELLKNKIKEDSKKYDGNKTIIFLGDYIDRGLKSKELINNLIYDKLEGFEEVFLMGNHEEFILNAFADDWHHIISWLYNGGINCLRSYGLDVTKYVPYKDISAEYSGIPLGVEEILRPIVRDTLNNMPEKHKDFFHSLKLFHRTDKYIFVHAGVNPSIPFSDQTSSDLLWIREKFLYSDRDYGVRIIHGHTPRDTVEIKPNRIGVDTGAYHGGVLSAIALSDDNDPYVIDTNELKISFE